jgi:hypothetical protein
VHTAEVPQQREVAELAFLQEAGERLLLVSATGQRDFPRVRGLERAVGDLLERKRLLCRGRLGVRQEQDVTEFDGTVAVVLRDGVFVELPEARARPFFIWADSGRSPLRQ